MWGYNRFFSALLTIGCLCSCGEKPGKGDILSVNDMKLVVWDMIRVDEFAASFVVKDSSINLNKKTNELYQKVFVLHKTDSARFFKSFAYYRNHPADYKILLDSLNAFSNREKENRFRYNKIDKVQAK